MNKFKVGDRVRVNETQKGGWGGHLGTVKTAGEDHWLGEYTVEMDPNRFKITDPVHFHEHELDAVVETPVVKESKKITHKDLNRLLRKARRTLRLYDDPESTLQEYTEALRKFEKAVEEVVNK